MPETFTTNAWQTGSTSVNWARKKFYAFSFHLVIELYFNPEGTKKLADVTRTHIGEKLSVFVNGQLIIAPMIREEIKGGEATMTFGFPTPEELKILNLFKGALQQ